MTLRERDNQVLWHPYTQMQLEPYAIPIVRGEGSWLIDQDNNRYLDAISSWWVNLYGHAHPEIKKAIADQAEILEQVIFAGFTHEPAIQLGEQLLSLLPGQYDRVFYTDNGSTAVEVALKMAIQYFENTGEKRDTLICLKESYHGDTFGAMSVSERGVFTLPFREYLFEVHTVHVGDTETLKSILQNNSVAAFIFEPLVQGAGGMLMHSAEMLSPMLELVANFGALNIADEVMTGFGRTHYHFATESLSIQPDIICLSKGITGGFLPLGATVTTNKIFEAFLSDNKLNALFHGHSYTANPLACAAAIAGMKLLTSEAVTKQRKAIETDHLQFKAKIQSHPAIQNPRTNGTIFALDLLTTNGSSYLDKRRDTLYQRFLKKGLLIRPLGNVIHLLPPYCITAEERSLCYQAIEEEINRL